MQAAKIRASNGKEHAQAQSLAPPHDAPVPPVPSITIRQASAHLIRVPEAARLTGLPQSLLRKSFMREDRRPKNVPPPPPHLRIGRAVYIYAGRIPGWLSDIGIALPANAPAKRRRGRPTVAERIALRERASA